MLDEFDIRRGLKFIVGKWQPDYFVNAFSDDLAHIPASEFKSDDGTDFTAITFEFFEDKRLTMTNSKSGKTVDGTWEQTDMFKYRYTVGDFFDIPDSSMLESIQTLQMQGENLVFSLGFVAVALKKTEEGTVTEKEDIGDIQPTEEDMNQKDIVGKYEVAKSMGMVNGKFGVFSKDEILAELNKRLEAGEIDEDEVKDSMRSFDAVVEFTDDHKVKTWMKLPEGVSEEEIRAAVEAGEISEVKDGFFAAAESSLSGFATLNEINSMITSKIA